MATFVANATGHENIQMAFETTEPISMKFHIYHLYDSYTKFSLKVIIRKSR